MYYIFFPLCFGIVILDLLSKDPPPRSSDLIAHRFYEYGNRGQGRWRGDEG